MLTCGVALASCDAITGPRAEPTVHVLSSIADVAVNPSVDFLPMCMPVLASEGRQLRFLGDTIRSYASGRMVHHSYQRSTGGDWAGSDRSRSLLSRGTIVFFRKDHSGRFGVESGVLVLDQGWCGPWRYPLVEAPAP